MERTFKTIMGTAVLILSFIFAAGSYCAPAPAKGKSPEEIVTKSCSNCHGFGKVCTKLGSRNKNAWTRTVYGMKGAGARIDENEIPVLAEYLAGLKPGSKPVCK